MNLCYYYPLNDGDRCIDMYMSKRTHYIEHKRLKEPDIFQKP